MKAVPSPYAERTGQVEGRPDERVVFGVRTRFWRYGSTDPSTSIVAVHGFRGDHHGLEAIIAHLVAAHPDVEVLAPDLPGFGISEAFTDRAHDIDGYSGWLAAFLEAVDAEGRMSVLGHSFGTIVAAAALARGLPAPRAVLVNPIASPALSGPNALGTRLAVFYYWLGARLPRRLGFALLRWRVVTRGMSVTMAKTRDPGLRRWIHNQHDRYFGAFASRDVVLEAFRASVSHDVSEYAAAIRVPVHLVAADRDDITPVADQHRLVALFPDATLTVLPGVGHLVHYEVPADAAREVADFVLAPQSGESS